MKIFIKILFIAIFIGRHFISSAQTPVIPKIEYEYTNITKTCDAPAAGINSLEQYGKQSPQSEAQLPVPCLITMSNDELNKMGQAGWELVSVTNGYTAVNQGYGTQPPMIRSFKYTQVYFFKRIKLMSEQQFYSAVNQIAQVKIDSSMSSIKRFIISTLNQSTKELFSTEYSDAMKESILTQIRAEMIKTVDSVIIATKRP